MSKFIVGKMIIGYAKKIKPKNNKIILSNNAETFDLFYKGKKGRGKLSIAFIEKIITKNEIKDPNFFVDIQDLIDKVSNKLFKMYSLKYNGEYKYPNKIIGKNLCCESESYMISKGKKSGASASHGSGAATMIGKPCLSYIDSSYSSGKVLTRG